MRGCEYKINDKSYTYQELFNYIVRNFEQLSNGYDITDIIFSEGDVNRDFIVNKLIAESTNTKLRRRNYNKQIDEIFDSPEDSKYIDIHDLIEKGQRVNKEFYVKQFNENELKTQMIKSLIDTKGITESEAEIEVNQKFSQFEQVELIGYHIHAAINLYFKGNRDPESLYEALSKIKTDENKDIYTRDFTHQLVENLKFITKSIYNNFGVFDPDKLTFISNYSIESPINGSDKKLYGNIDLIVVDEKGIPHIFLFKTSTNINSLQPEIKTEKRDYYLSFYRQMLMTKGIDASKASLNIVPVNVSLNSDNSLQSISMESPDDRTLRINKNGYNTLLYGKGKLWEDANNVIPVTLGDIKVTKDISKKVDENLQKMFPTKDLIKLKTGIDLETFIKKFVRPSSDIKYAWEFTDIISGKIIYISDNSPKENNTEVFEAVTEHLQSREEAREQSTVRLIEHLKKCINNNIPLTQFHKTSQATGNLLITLGHYTNGTWEVLSDGVEYLEMLGVLTVKNKSTNQVDFIYITPEINMNTEYSLGLGTTILGAFKRNSEVYNPEYVLPSTNGNINLMKLMCIINELAISENSNLKNITIGDLKVLNTNTGEGVIAHPKQIQHSFNLLCKESGITNNTSSLKWLSDINILKNRILAILGSAMEDTAVIKSMFAELEKVDPFKTEACVSVIDKMIIQLETTYPSFIQPDINQAQKDAAGTPSGVEILNLYILLHQTRAYLTGTFHQVKAMSGLTGSIKHRDLLNSRLTTTPDTVPDKNILNATKAARESFVVIRDKFSNFADNVQSKIFKPFYKAKGYSQVENIIIGDQTKLYRNLFREKDGKLNPNLLFKNPDDSSENLTVEERELLRNILWIINKRRFNLTSENSEEALKYKQTDKWFWVPLTEATMSSKATSRYIIDRIDQERESIESGIKLAKQRIRETEEYLYSDEAEKQANELNKNYQLFNYFSYSEADEDSRQTILNSQPITFWETNIETLLLKYEYAHIRKEILDRVLPVIKSIRVLTEAFGQIAMVKTTENIHFLENYIKQAIYGRTLYSEEERELASRVKTARHATSVLMVAGNIVAPVRDTLEGLWKVIGTFVGNQWGKNKGFNFEDYLWAQKTLLVDMAESTAGMTMCEALNRRLGIANQDVNMLAERYRSGRSGLFNINSKMYCTATAGDYVNRMSLLLAKMHHDGCFEACSWDENGFKYNWKKDKRFEHYANGNTSHPKYNEEKGLYLSMLRDFNESGYNLKEGDDLPLFYTPNEVTVIKSFADRMYGYYDHDIRMQLEGTALGSIFMQFSTYLTSLKTTWLLPGGFYDNGTRKQKVDENGNLMYWEEEVDENGNKRYIPTANSTSKTGIPNSPILDTGQSYMEGIFYTLYEFYNDFKTSGLSRAITSIKENDVKTQNLRLFGYQLVMWIIIGNIVKYLLSLWTQKRKEDTSPYTKTRVLGDGVFNIFNRAVQGSFSNFNIISAFGGNILNSEPPMIGMATKMFTSSYRTITEGRSLDYWLKTNISAYRSLSGFTEGIEKYNEAN